MPLFDRERYGACGREEGGEVELVGEEGVRLFAVGKREVRGREGRRRGHRVGEREGRQVEG